MAVTAQADDEAQKVISTAIDSVFYITIYGDIPEGRSALQHYVMQGWREGRDPTPWFSTEAYLAANDDVREAGHEPLWHYLTHGRHEGREVAPSRHALRYAGFAGCSPPRWVFEGVATAAGLDPARPPTVQRDQMVAATEFDAEYYRARYPDVAEAGVDPLFHFVTAGWRERRDPNPRFSVADYLETYPDIAELGVNPFVHYLVAGRDEGRIARHDLGFRYQIIARGEPVATRVAHDFTMAARREPQARSLLEAGLAEARFDHLHVTFSHDNYAEHLGGLQQCVRREGAAFRARGADHLHLYPAHSWRLVREAGDPGALGVVLNGTALGVFSPADIRAVLATAAGSGPARRSFAIHNMLGHAADETADILGALGLTVGFFWLHDFVSLCAGFHLLRNDVADCGAPPPDSAACGICDYGPWRRRHLDAHARLFERLELTVVAPSETTLTFWQESWRFAAKDTVVLPHATLTPRGRAPAAPKDRPFRVAFMGLPTPLKGWPIFRELAERHAEDPRYEFHQLGGAAEALSPATFHKVAVSDASPNAMREAVEALEADAALIWPLCRETFSFTAYEAAAAGAAVVTGPDSGNVAAFVQETGLGRVLASEADLAEAFASGEILKLARARRRPQLFELAYSRMSADLAPGGPA